MTEKLLFSSHLGVLKPKINEVTTQHPLWA